MAGVAESQQDGLRPGAADNPWPEWPKVSKTDYGQEEAIALFGHDPRIYETTIKEFLKDKDGNLRAVKTVGLRFEKDPQTGRRKMTEVPGSEKELPCEVLVIAAGFLGPEKYVTDAFGVETTERSNVKTAEGGYQTSVEKVFSCGECAEAVDKSLMGYTNIRVQ